ncbi:MAG: carbohydrate kinase [Acidobacteria bacterium]|nr:carbohydrate kinase [Acidobacteriota bacterium]
MTANWQKPVVVGLGEVLWDLFPAGKQLGGAPANFAYISSLLGNAGAVASRVGDDVLGEEIRLRFLHSGFDTLFLQEDPLHPTGTVKVIVRAAGQPQFEITQAVAWDYLEWNSAWRDLAGRTDAVCFGSLAQRSPQSRETIRKFLAATPRGALRIFDVNLRQSYYSAEVLRESIRAVQMVKLNEDELPRVLELLGLPRGDERSSAQILRRQCNLQLVCVTRGERGSLLVGADALDEHPGFSVQVADTVGAGDAFTAGLVHSFLRGAALSVVNEVANRMGAWVSTQAGGMPAPEATQLEAVHKLLDP